MPDIDWGDVAGVVIAWVTILLIWGMMLRFIFGEF